MHIRDETGFKFSIAQKIWVSWAKISIALLGNEEHRLNEAKISLCNTETISQLHFMDYFLIFICCSTDM